MFIFIIVITLLVFLLVVVVSFALIGNKMIGRLRNRKKGLLTTYYTERINRILFEELPEQHYHKDMDIYHDLVANLFEPTQRDLEGLSLFQKSIRRDVIKQTMITMARDLTGETRYRLPACASLTWRHSGPARWWAAFSPTWARTWSRSSRSSGRTECGLPVRS